VKKKLTIEYVKNVIDPQVRKFCGPVFFTISLTTPLNTIPHNGTFGLVNTGQKKLIITCHHVWATFKKLRAEKMPNLLFGMAIDMPNPVVINADKMWVGEDAQSDLVSFDATDLIEICSRAKSKFYSLHVNPPPPLRIKDMVYLIGFPGKGRQTDEISVGFQRQGIGLEVVEIKTNYFYAGVQGLNKGGDDFAGISGAPCFVFRQGQPLKLVGFAMEFVEMLQMVKFSYVQNIRSDGSIGHIL
jgi:hypothetical protein